MPDNKSCSLQQICPKEPRHLTQVWSIVLPTQTDLDYQLKQRKNGSNEVYVNRKKEAETETFNCSPDIPTVYSPSSLVLIEISCPSITWLKRSALPHRKNNDQFCFRFSSVSVYSGDAFKCSGLRGHCVTHANLNKL